MRITFKLDGRNIVYSGEPVVLMAELPEELVITLNDQVRLALTKDEVRSLRTLIN